jgi:hypothetical protein
MSKGYNPLNKYCQIRDIQQKYQAIYDANCGFISTKAIWKQMYHDKDVYVGYGTFLKYISLGGLNFKIAELEAKKGVESNSKARFNQLELFSDDAETI